MRLLMLPGLDGSGKLFRPLLQVLPSHLKAQVTPYPADRVLSYDALVAFVRRGFPRGEPFVLLGEWLADRSALNAFFRRLKIFALLSSVQPSLPTRCPHPFHKFRGSHSGLPPGCFNSSLLMLWSAFTPEAWIRLRIYSSCFRKQKRYLPECPCWSTASGTGGSYRT